MSETLPLRGRPAGRCFPGCTVLSCLVQVEDGGQGTQPPLMGKPMGRGHSQQKANVRGTEDSIVWWLQVILSLSALTCLSVTARSGVNNGSSAHLSSRVAEAGKGRCLITAHFHGHTFLSWGRQPSLRFLCYSQGPEKMLARWHLTNRAGSSPPFFKIPQLPPASIPLPHLPLLDDRVSKQNRRWSESTAP